MSVFWVLVLFSFGLFFIIKGGDLLVRAAISLNQISGINQVIIGATFVSVATTLPEVFVSIFAVSAENHGIAVGNAIGAMIVNIALVLGLSLAFLQNRLTRQEIMGKSIFLLIITVVVFLFALNLKLSWYEGVILITAFILFLAYNAYSAKKSPSDLLALSSEIESFAKKSPCVKPRQGSRYWRIAFGFVVGQAMLIAGAFAIVENGERLAHIFGISETVIGFTIIAIGTSLPELTTAITSIRCKSGGLAIGNVIGSNVINCTLLLGVCGIIGDIKGNSLPVSRETVFIAFPILIILSSIAILPIIIKKRTYRWQGFALITLYFAYLIYLLIAQPV